MEPETFIPVRLADLARWKKFGIDGGTHAEGAAMAAAIDLIYDNWALSQRVAASPAPEPEAPTPPVVAAANGNRHARRVGKRLT